MPSRCSTALVRLRVHGYNAAGPNPVVGNALTGHPLLAPDWCERNPMTHRFVAVSLRVKIRFRQVLYVTY